MSFAGEKVLAQAVVITVSKMATMYATMLPPVEPTDAAVMALLRHNDLQYLSNHMLLLPFLYGPTLEELVGGQVWFGSEATRLCAAAKQVFNASVSATAAAIRALHPSAKQQHSPPSSSGLVEVVMSCVYLLSAGVPWPS